MCCYCEEFRKCFRGYSGARTESVPCSGGSSTVWGGLYHLFGSLGVCGGGLIVGTCEVF